MNIERASSDGIGPLLHPNHLVFNAVGFLFYWPLHTFFPDVRALPVLQGLDILAGVLTSLILGRMLVRLGCGTYHASMLTGVFVFGASWWKFSVDADAYILAALFLLLSAQALIFAEEGSGQRPLLAAGLFHCVAMLIHQLGVLFLPAVWTGIWCRLARTRPERFRSAATYTVLTGMLTFAAYYCGYSLSESRSQYGSFLRWIASHSAESSFTINPVYIVAGTVKSYAQLLFGGRFRLFVQFFHPWMAAPAAILFVSALLLAARMWRARAGLVSKFWSALHQALTLPAFRISGAWFVSYALFLLFWLPRNTFYKLMLWPALILCTGCVLKQARMAGFSAARGMALLVASQFCWNLIFFIYPYSRTASNRVLDFAQQASRIWAPGELILFRTFDTDDWTIRYFTPQTVWESLDCSGDNCIATIESERTRGNVWLDPTAVQFLETATAGTKRWLDAGRHTGMIAECCGAKWPVRFLRVAQSRPPNTTKL